MSKFMVNQDDPGNKVIDWQSNRNSQRNKSIEEKFWEKVNVGEEEKCWEWMASISHRGYGQFRFQGWMQSAHRVAWILTYGEIPEHNSYHGMCVCHTCDSRKCCNPFHLFLGTHQDNINDMMNKGRQGNTKGIPRYVPSGQNNPNAKLTNEDILNIIKLYTSGKYTQSELGKLYGVHRKTISRNIVKYNWLEGKG